MTTGLCAAHLQVDWSYERCGSEDRRVNVPDIQELSSSANTFNPVMEVVHKDLARGPHDDLWQ